MTAPRAFYLTLPNGNPKLLTVNTLGELQDIVLAHYRLESQVGLRYIESIWDRDPRLNNSYLKEVIA